MGAIDAEAHVVECEKTFDYIDPEFHDLRPRVMVQKSDDVVEMDNAGVAAQREYWVIDGRLQPKEGNIGHETTKESREMANVNVRLAHMDELDIDIQVLYPTVFLRAWTQDPTAEFALCKSYNRWLAGFCQAGPGRRARSRTRRCRCPARRTGRRPHAAPRSVNPRPRRARSWPRPGAATWAWSAR